MYADVIVDLSLEKLDRIFQYRFPDDWPLLPEETIGKEVEVPFGAGDRVRSGFVTGISEETDYDPEKIKPLLRLVPKAVSVESKQIRMAAFLRRTYGGTMHEALKTVLPVSRETTRLVKKSISLKLEVRDVLELLERYERRHASVRIGILKAVLAEETVDKEQLTRTLGSSASAAIREMVRENILTETTSVEYRKAFNESELQASNAAIRLNPDQDAAVQTFCENWKTPGKNGFLLYGITGSGKTEVYMAMMEAVIREGKQVIFLIPEIALTLQMVARLGSRFGSRLSILNSRMSDAERYDQYLRAKEGDIDIIVGPRSCLFTPFQNLGLIIVDEEHETSYKSGKTPRYHARETAIFRAEEEQAAIVLGSATPSLEAMKLVQEGRLRELRLDKRASGAALPEIAVVDLREEMERGNRSILSEKLSAAMRDTLARGEQIMLFLNRRGYAGFVSCRSCGEVIRCPHCDVSLTYHKPGRLICHYCGHEEQMPAKCPKCGSPYIARFGLGTEKVEEMVKDAFPAARVLRMDADTTARKGSHEQILKAFRDGKADILIGTQMIVKGHDFEKVSLVGILAADLSLFANDFRAGERTYDLLVQASGRAGRGRYPGTVVIQTYHPEHYSVQAAASGDADGFYAKEQRYRRMLGYPPEGHLLAVIFLGEDAEAVMQAAKAIRGLLPDQEAVTGPVWATIPKVKDIYRALLYAKDADYEKLIAVRERVSDAVKAGKIPGSVQVQFDFDPQGTY